MDIKTPLTKSSIKNNYTYTVYNVYSTLSKQAATHLELCIQQNLQSLIPGHLLNRGTDNISYQHATVDYNKTSSKVYRVYVAVFKRLRQAINRGHVAFTFRRRFGPILTLVLSASLRRMPRSNGTVNGNLCTISSLNT